MAGCIFFCVVARFSPRGVVGLHIPKIQLDVNCFFTFSRCVMRWSLWRSKISKRVHITLFMWFVTLMSAYLIIIPSFHYFFATRSPLVLSPLSWTQCATKRAIPFQVPFVFLQNQYVGRLHAPPDAANPTENYRRPHFRVPLVSRVGHFQMREDAPARGVNQTTTHGSPRIMETQPFPHQRGK